MANVKRCIIRITSILTLFSFALTQVAPAYALRRTQESPAIREIEAAMTGEPRANAAAEVDIYGRRYTFDKAVWDGIRRAEPRDTAAIAELAQPVSWLGLFAAAGIASFFASHPVGLLNWDLFHWLLVILKFKYLADGIAAFSLRAIYNIENILYSKFKIKFPKWPVINIPGRTGNAKYGIARTIEGIIYVNKALLSRFPGIVQELIYLSIIYPYEMPHLNKRWQLANRRNTYTGWLINEFTAYTAGGVASIYFTLKALNELAIKAYEAYDESQRRANEEVYRNGSRLGRLNEEFDEIWEAFFTELEGKFQQLSGPDKDHFSGRIEDLQSNIISLDRLLGRSNLMDDEDFSVARRRLDSIKAEFTRLYEEIAGKFSGNGQQAQLDTAKDYYKLFGVAPDAPQRQIKGIYRHAARTLHPDFHPEDSEKYNSIFKDWTEAYSVLGKEEERQRYNLAMGYPLPVEAGAIGRREFFTAAAGASGKSVILSEEEDNLVNRLWLEFAKRDFAGCKETVKAIDGLFEDKSGSGIQTAFLGSRRGIIGSRHFKEFAEYINDNAPHKELYCKSVLRLALENLQQHAGDSGVLITRAQFIDGKILRFTFILLDAGGGFVDLKGNHAPIDAAVKPGETFGKNGNQGLALSRIVEAAREIEITSIDATGAYYWRKTGAYGKEAMLDGQYAAPVKTGTKIVFTQDIPYAADASAADALGFNKTSPIKVLFVCNYNLERSPLAAGLLTAMLPQGLRRDVSVDSCGVFEIDNSAVPFVRSVLWENTGSDILAGYHSKQITEDLARDATVIYVMTKKQGDEIIQMFSATQPGIAGKIRLVLGRGRELEDIDGASGYKKLFEDLESAMIENVIPQVRAMVNSACANAASQPAEFWHNKVAVVAPASVISDDAEWQRVTEECA